MNNSTIKLTDDLVSRFLTKTVSSLLSENTTDDVCVTVSRSDSLKVQTYAMHSVGALENSITLYYNLAFVKKVMTGAFGDAVNIEETENLFIAHVIETFFKEWLDEHSIKNGTISKHSKVKYCYYSCILDEIEVIIRLDSSIINNIYQSSIMMDTKKRINADVVKSSMLSSSLLLSVSIPDIGVSCKDILSIKKGDVIKTERKTDEGLVLSINENVISNNAFISFENDKAVLVLGSVKYGS